MLTEQEKALIEEEASRYPHKRAVVPEALKIVQQRHGWVSDDQVREIADFLNMTPDEVDDVATFYNLIYRQPVGRHIIHICDSVSCWIMGYDHIREYLTQRLGIRLGQTTEDGRFTMLPIACLGDCDHAPAMMIDDELYGSLTPEQVDEILARYA
ncbi:MAG: NADH-quinone oxidoreductase subunit NuoE [Armatimonadota bacterium]